MVRPPSQFRRLALALIFLQQSHLYATSNIMFEGYSSITAGDSALGYVVQRYELDQKKKQLISTYMIKTKEATESLKAIANDAFQPIRYQYTMKDGDKVKLIDVQFKGNQMIGMIQEGKDAKVTKKINKKIDQGVFLSSFLGYLMLQKGIGVGKNFIYKAVAEEDGEVHSGEAWVKEETVHKGHKVYRIENTFKDAKFTSFVTLKGEVLATASTDSTLKTELKSTAAEATAGFPVPQETLKLLFGSVPKGTTHSLASLSPQAPQIRPQSELERAVEIRPPSTQPPSQKTKERSN